MKQRSIGNWNASSKVHFKKTVTALNENTNADAAPPSVLCFDPPAYWQYSLNYIILRKFQQAPLLCVRILNENKGRCRISHGEVFSGSPLAWNHPLLLCFTWFLCSANCIANCITNYAVLIPILSLLTRNVTSKSSAFLSNKSIRSATLSLSRKSYQRRMSSLSTPTFSKSVLYLLLLSIYVTIFLFCISLSKFFTSDFFPEALCTSKVRWFSKGKSCSLLPQSLNAGMIIKLQIVYHVVWNYIFFKPSWNNFLFHILGFFS